jgi:hypothetical protein
MKNPSCRSFSRERVCEFQIFILVYTHCPQISMVGLAAPILGFSRDRTALLFQVVSGMNSLEAGARLCHFVILHRRDSIAHLNEKDVQTISECNCSHNFYRTPDPIISMTLQLHISFHPFLWILKCLGLWFWVINLCARPCHH